MMSWIKTNVDLAGACVAALFFLCSSAALGYNLIQAHGEIKAGERLLTKTTGERDTARRDLGSCHTSLANEAAAVDAQNAAVEALRADGDRKAQKAAQALQQAQKQADGYHTQALNLANAKPVGDRCVAAADLLRGELSR